MRSSKRTAVILAVGVVFTAGCATAPLRQGRRCSESPESSVDIFLRGVTELSLALIQSVIPEGVSPLAVFGKGDRARGREIVLEILDHPEVRRGNEVDNTYRLVSIARESDRVRIVVIERQADVTFLRENAGTRSEFYLRTFRTEFDLSQNCILAVNPIEPAWTRLK